MDSLKTMKRYKQKTFVIRPSRFSMSGNSQSFQKAGSFSILRYYYVQYLLIYDFRQLIFSLESEMKQVLAESFRLASISSAMSLRSVSSYFPKLKPSFALFLILVQLFARDYRITFYLHKPRHQCTSAFWCSEKEFSYQLCKYLLSFHEPERLLSTVSQISQKLTLF